MHEYVGGEIKMGEEISASRLVQIVREEVRNEVRKVLEERDKELIRALIKIIAEGGTVKAKRGTGERQVITAGKG